MTIIMKFIKNTPAFFSTVSWCLSMSWKASKFYTVMRISSEITTPILIIVMTFIGRQLINLLAGVQIADDAEATLLFLFSLQLGAALLMSGNRKVNQYCQSMHEDIFEKMLSITVIDNALSADVELFDNADYYDKLQSAGRDSYAIMHMLWSTISCLSAAISFITVFSLLSRINGLYGLLMMAAAIPSSIAAARYTKLLYGLSLKQIKGYRVMSYYQSIVSSKQYVQDIRLYNAGELIKSRYTQKWKELFIEKKAMTRKRTMLTTLLDFLPETAIVLISISIAIRILRGAGTVGDYSLYAGLISQLWTSIIILSSSIMQIYDNKLKITNFKSLSKFKTRIADNGKLQLKAVETVEFENVTFTYPGAVKPALQSISFLLKPKEKITIVGLNGSGKSTLIKLLLRMYEPDSGIVRINDRNIKDYPISEVRRNFSVYFQDMQNYSLTIRENLTIADSKRTCIDKDAVSVFESSGGIDILNKSPMRLDAHLTRLIETDGIELSGGEYQKVALARTFYRSHTALILDEPSSNLDPEAENKLFQSLRKLSDGKLTIYTSHRLSNSALADRIIVLEDGRVLEIGTQEELMNNKSRYAELFRYQQEKYMVGGD